MPYHRNLWEWKWTWNWKYALYVFFKIYFLIAITVILFYALFKKNKSGSDSINGIQKKEFVELFDVNETASTSNTSSVHILPKKEAALFLLEDKDKYIQSMSTSDLFARKVTCQEAYRLFGYESVLEANESQLSILQKACKLADDFFASYISSSKTTEGPKQLDTIKGISYFDTEKAKSIPWNIILVKEAFEQGLPHTRENYIILHPSLLERPLDELISTLIHEKVHLYQRKYRKEKTFIKSENREDYLTDYMVSKMGFEKIKRRDEVSCDIRTNPDIDEWIYNNPKTKKEMYLCYRSSKPTGIEDVIGESKEEHPYEYIAYEIGKLYETSKK